AVAGEEGADVEVVEQFDLRCQLARGDLVNLSAARGLAAGIVVADGDVLAVARETEGVAVPRDHRRAAFAGLDLTDRFAGAGVPELHPAREIQGAEDFAVGRVGGAGVNVEAGGLQDAQLLASRRVENPYTLGAVQDKGLSVGSEGNGEEVESC